MNPYSKKLGAGIGRPLSWVLEGDRRGRCRTPRARLPVQALLIVLILATFAVATAASLTRGQSAPDASSTASASSTGTVYFDGRAKNMNEHMTPGDTSAIKQGQAPNTWTCICFNHNSMSLVADSRYGKAYKNVVGPSDTNPWNGAAPATNGAGQLSRRRDNDLGKWDWYAIAVKVPSSWQHPPWTSLVSLGYETLASDQVALGIKTTASGTYFTMHQNSGLVSKTSTGFYAGAVSYVASVVPVTYDAWQEFVIGVKWATDNTGAVEVYSRTPGSRWQHAFEKLNEPTYAYGTTSYGTIDADLSKTPTVIDKIGLYFGGYSTPRFPTETVYESGLTRSSTLATAKSTLP